MVKCKYLAYNEKVLFGTIAEEKDEPGRTQLSGIYDTVVNRYESYLSNFDTVGTISDSPFAGGGDEGKLIRNLLESCYDSATKTFKAIRGRIFSCQPAPILSLCPYCLLNWPKTLDHYVAKTAFPEFSILCKNLIPCCWDCNHKKREKWRENGQRRIIHFYNDSFLEHRFLKARLAYTPGIQFPKIEYYLEQPAQMTDEQFQLAEWHFEDLGLLAKYNQRAGTTFSSEYATAYELRDMHIPSEIIRQMLLKKHQAHEAAVCTNYYEAVIYETLANDATFLASLTP